MLNVMHKYKQKKPLKCMRSLIYCNKANYRLLRVSCNKSL